MFLEFKLIILKSLSILIKKFNIDIISIIIIKINNFKQRHNNAKLMHSS
jgi:hypothetical protein